ncbi:hypothetical protein [Microbacterium luticocti]|uniref:hypothetical protein n=1 Tax=Microbacterium luticocti TaxID=451764 RepID=UPI0004254280|nr:hypothetical protein [Microbacterium luticocti]
MTPRPSHERPLVLRALSSQIAFWALVGIAVIFVGDAALRGRIVLALRAGAILLFVLWCAWVFLVRMSIRLDAEAVTAHNLLRWVRVPWGRVADVERRAQLRIVLDDGHAVECWGSPFAPRAGARSTHGDTDVTPPTPAKQITATDTPGRQPTGAGVRRTPGVDGALQAVRGAWQDAPVREPGAVRRGWDVPAVLIGVVCAVCALLAVVL